MLKKKTLIFIFIFIFISLLSFAFFYIDNSHKIYIRSFLFNQETSLNVFRASPGDQGDYGFLPIRDDVKNEFININKRILAEKNLLVIKAHDPVEVATKVALLYRDPPVESGPVSPQCGLKSESLIANIDWVLGGRGCCSDHSQVFIAIASLNGLYAREVHNSRHTFNEFWHVRLKKWIWIDSQFGALATNENGDLLGLADIIIEFRKKKRVKFIYFNDSRIRKVGRTVVRDGLYDEEAFASIAITLGNDVFMDDAWARRLWFLPKEVRLFFLMAFGVSPRIAVYKAA